MPLSLPSGVIARTTPSTVISSTVQVARSKNGAALPMIPPNSEQSAAARSPEPVSSRIFCQVSLRVSPRVSCSSAAPMESSARVSARVHRLNLSGNPTAHSRNITYSIPQMESITRA